MNFIEDIFKSPPDFVNEEGIKWWFDEDTTQWAKNEDLSGVSLDIVCYFVEGVDGTRTRALVDPVKGLIYADSKLEAVAAHIDMLRLLKRFSAAG